MSGIVLDAGAESCLLQHLDIKIGPLRNPLRFQELVMFLKPCYPFFQFLLNGYHRLLNLLLRHHIVGRRENSRISFRLALISPVRISICMIRSISSPKNSTRMAVLKVLDTGRISSTSPRTRKVPRLKSISFLYILDVNQSPHAPHPGPSPCPAAAKSSSPRNPSVASDTVNTGHRGATMITSFRSIRAAVADCAAAYRSHR